jgi:hypothetical protein
LGWPATWRTENLTRYQWPSGTPLEGIVVRICTPLSHTLSVDDETLIRSAVAAGPPVPSETCTSKKKKKKKKEISEIIKDRGVLS